MLVKKVISGLGSVIGVGLQTVPFVALQAVGYNQVKNEMKLYNDVAYISGKLIKYRSNQRPHIVIDNLNI
jgi:hypothetical protein